MIISKCWNLYKLISVSFVSASDEMFASLGEEFAIFTTLLAGFAQHSRPCCRVDHLLQGDETAVYRRIVPFLYRDSSTSNTPHLWPAALSFSFPAGIRTILHAQNSNMYLWSRDFVADRLSINQSDLFYDNHNINYVLSNYICFPVSGMRAPCWLFPRLFFVFHFLTCIIGLLSGGEKKYIQTKCRDLLY